MLKTIQTLSYHIYEILEDVHTSKLSVLDKQKGMAGAKPGEAAPLQVRDVTITRLDNISFEEIVVKYKDQVLAIEGLDCKEVKEMLGYPLLRNKYNEKDYVVDPTTKCTYTVVYGVDIETRRRSPNETIIVKPDATQEERTKAIEESLKPYDVDVPFIFAIPEVDQVAVDIILTRLAPEAITKWDSSKKDVDPNLAKDDAETILHS